jgi:hypothetical protein
MIFRRWVIRLASVHHKRTAVDGSFRSNKPPRPAIVSTRLPRACPPRVQRDYRSIWDRTARFQNVFLHDAFRFVAIIGAVQERRVASASDGHHIQLPAFRISKPDPLQFLRSWN